MIYLDTHVVVWLYAGLTDRLADEVRKLVNSEELLVSPVVGLELQYLYETSRTAAQAGEVLEDLSLKLGLRQCSRAFPAVAASAVRQTWTRDPFDRIIVGQAALENDLLVTKDRLIRDHYPRAFWA